MPSTPISEQDVTVPANGEISRQFNAASRFAAVEVAVADSDSGAIDVYIEGRLAEFLPWSNVDEPDQTTGDPKNVRGIPPWVGLSAGDTRGPTDVDVPAIPELRFRIVNTSGSDATVSMVARSY